MYRDEDNLYEVHELGFYLTDFDNEFIELEFNDGRSYKEIIESYTLNELQEELTIRCFNNPEAQEGIAVYCFEEIKDMISWFNKNHNISLSPEEIQGIEHIQYAI